MNILKRLVYRRGGVPLPRIPEQLPKKAVSQLRDSYDHPVEATVCGHLTGCIAVVWLDDEWTVTDMSKMPAPTYCGYCLAEMAIRCGWCGKAIFIGDPVTLYTKRDGVLPDLPERAVIYDQETATLVGCLGWECADTGADRAGFWLPDPENPGHGHVKLHESLYSRAEREGIVIVEDLSKP